jgi:hypothetical protein
MRFGECDMFNSSQLKDLEKKYRGGVPINDLIAIFLEKGHEINAYFLRECVFIRAIEPAARRGVPGKRGYHAFYPINAIPVIAEVLDRRRKGQSWDSISRTIHQKKRR